METEISTKEWELVNALYEAEPELFSLSNKVNRETDEESKEQLARKIRKLEDIKRTLSEYGADSMASMAKDQMIKQLESYITSFGNALDKNLGLSRNQNTSIENQVIATIVLDLKKQLTQSPSGITDHYHLYYSTFISPQSCLDLRALIDFLKQSLSTLNSVDSPDYLKLMNFLHNFRSAIYAEFGTTNN